MGPGVRWGINRGDGGGGYALEKRVWATREKGTGPWRELGQQHSEKVGTIREGCGQTKRGAKPVKKRLESGIEGRRSGTRMETRSERGGTRREKGGNVERRGRKAGS